MLLHLLLLLLVQVSVATTKQSMRTASKHSRFVTCTAVIMLASLIIDLMALTAYPCVNVNEQDNLTQMNAYADHLEIVIGQCPSCSVKVQTESTQDIESKAS